MFHLKAKKIYSHKTQPKTVLKTDKYPTNFN
jgi:hypothetical protein